MLLGDFNDILHYNERIGTRANNKPGPDFINFVEKNGLEDIRFTGNFYTWTNKQMGDDRICSKIDRVLANQRWLSMFDMAEAVFLNEACFDHSPVIVSCRPIILNCKKSISVL